MWTYEQRSGNLYDASNKLCATGYSGNGVGKNNPDMQSVHDVGPIPQGKYVTNPPHDTPSHGPYVLPLTPDPANQMFGRSGFLMHGDSVSHPGEASNGCIIMPRLVRQLVWGSGDRMLQVVSNV